MEAILITFSDISDKPCTKLSAENRELMIASSVELDRIAEDTEVNRNDLRYRVHQVASVCDECPSLMPCRIMGHLYREDGIWGGLDRIGRKRWALRLMRPELQEDMAADHAYINKNASRQQKNAIEGGRALHHPGLDAAVFGQFT